MVDIYDYPKSSCNHPPIQFAKGIPTNMPVRNCDFSGYSSPNYYQQHQFKLQKEPNNKNGEIILNPDVDKYDETFCQINPKQYPFSSCPKTTYLLVFLSQIE